MVNLLLSHSHNANARDSWRWTPLHVAIGIQMPSHRHEAAMRLIREQSVDVEAEDEEGRSPLCFASSADCTLCADSLLRRGARVDGGSFPPLCVAAGVNNTNSMRFLMQNGASLNATDQDGISPLHRAVFNGRMEATLLLIFEGADIYLKDNGGDTALTIAIRRKHVEIAKIIENHADPNAMFDKEKQMAHLQLMIDLKAAAQKGSQEEVREILQRATFSPLELKGALLAAVKGESRGHTEVTKILLQQGAKDTQEGVVDVTSLHYAAQGGNVETLDHLLSVFQDFNMKDFNGLTPLLRAIGWFPSQHRHMATMRLLEEDSVDVEADDDKGKTPLFYASQVGCVICVDLLLQRGANPDGGAVAPLVVAVEDNYTNIMRTLLKNGAQVNKTDKNGTTALHFAAYFGQKEAVQLLLLEGADVNVMESHGKTALDFAIQQENEGIVNILKKHKCHNAVIRTLADAASNNDIEELNLLLRNGASVNEVDAVGSPALHTAARHGHQEAVHVLLTGGADVTLRDGEGRTALDVALGYNDETIATFLVEHMSNDIMERLFIESALRGHIDVFKFLIDRISSPNVQEEQQWTALHHGVIRGHIEVVRILLNRGATVDAKDSKGGTPLLYASIAGRLECVEILLTHGADANCATNEGTTPLLHAALHGHKGILQLLLTHGAAVNVKNNAGSTPLTTASQMGHLGCVEILLTQGAHVNCTTNEGTTPLWHAVYDGHQAILELLVTHGAVVDSKDNSGNTALKIASQMGQLDSVEFLLRHGADVNAISSDGSTPLLSASMQGHLEVMWLLLCHGADVNQADNDGDSPLHKAASRGQKRALEMLLKEGAYKALVNDLGMTALDIVLENNDVECVDLLLADT